MRKKFVQFSEINSNESKNKDFSRWVPTSMIIIWMILSKLNVYRIK